MNRAEFMRQLERLLQGISPTEREEALQYYNSYFDDAGVENEQEVIRALGSPARVAENIKSGLFEGGIVEVRQPEYNENVYGNSAGRENRYENSTGSEDSYHDRTGGGSGCDNSTRKNELPAWAIVLIVLGCVFAAPVIVPLAVGIIAAIFGLTVAWFSVIFGFAVAAVALFAVLVFLVVLACMCFVVEPLVSLALMGGGLICGGLGVLFLMLTVAMAGIATPAIFRGIGHLFHPRRRAVA